ncbi:hypothetical protein AAZX31_18G115900 [Glycine max]
MTINYNIEWSNSKLDGKLDFHYWELLMVTHLRVHNIWSFVESGLEEGANIHQAVDYSIFDKITNAKTAKEASNILKLSYKGVEKAYKSNLQSLRREYKSYEMSSFESCMEKTSQTRRWWTKFYAPCR